MKCKTHVFVHEKQFEKLLEAIKNKEDILIEARGYSPILLKNSQFVVKEVTIYSG
jgi:hypothetical protein